MVGGVGIRLLSFLTLSFPESSRATQSQGEEQLRAKVAKSAENEAKTSEVSDLSHDVIATPTPGQLSVIESNSFTSDKFVSKRASKKWDMTPSDVAKKSVPAAKSFDVTDVDPSEYVPKVVPMCEVESALGREGEGEGVGGEEGGQQLVMINQRREDSSVEVWCILCLFSFPSLPSLSPSLPLLFSSCPSPSLPPSLLLPLPLSPSLSSLFPANCG